MQTDKKKEDWVGLNHQAHSLLFAAVLLLLQPIQIGRRPSLPDWGFKVDHDVSSSHNFVNLRFLATVVRISLFHMSKYGLRAPLDGSVHTVYCIYHTHISQICKIIFKAQSRESAYMRTIEV